MSLYDDLVKSLTVPGSSPDYTSEIFTYQDVSWDLDCSYEYARTMVLRAVENGLVSATKNAEGRMSFERITDSIRSNENFQTRLLNMVKNASNVDLSEVTDEVLLAEVQRRLNAA